MPLGRLLKPPATMDIIVYLASVGKADVTTMLSDLAVNNETFYSAIRKFKYLGFVFESKARQKPPHKYYSLTRRGRKAAEYLIPFDSMLCESLDEMKRDIESLRKARRNQKNLEKLHTLAGNLHEEQFLRWKWKEALDLANEALEAGRELGDSLRMAQAEVWVGLVLQKMDDNACTDHLERAYELAAGVGQLSLAAEASYILGSHFERTSKLDAASQRYEVCVELGSRAADPVQIALGEAGVGRILAKQGFYRQSYDRLQSARRRLEAVDARDELPKVLSSLGSTCLYLTSNVQEALQWQLKAIELSEENADVRALAYALMNAAGCYLELKEHGKALESLARSQELARDLDEAKLLSSVDLQLASLYQRTRRWKAAKDSAEEALNIAESRGFERDRAFANYIIGTIEKKRGNAKVARGILKAAANQFKRAGDDAMAREVDEAMRSLRR